MLDRTAPQIDDESAGSDSRRRSADHAPGSLAQLFDHGPRPLIDPRNKLVVIFSAKAASNSLLIWFYHHLGQLQAARDYSHAPHRYRTQVYYPSALYETACANDFSGYTVIRIVRDPYERATSMYRHALRFGLADNPIDRLRRVFGVEPRLSFAGFLGRLEKLDLSNCNIHFQQQRHPVEDRLPVDHLINVSREDLFERLAEIEADIGLPPSNLASSAWVADRSKRHHRATEGQTGVYQRSFTASDANSGGWPSYDAFLTDEARRRIAKLYDADIRSYFPDLQPKAAP